MITCDDLTVVDGFVQGCASLSFGWLQMIVVGFGSTKEKTKRRAPVESFTAESQRRGDGVVVSVQVAGYGHGSEERIAKGFAKGRRWVRPKNEKIRKR